MFVEIFPSVFRVDKSLGFKWRKSIREVLKSTSMSDFHRWTQKKRIIWWRIEHFGKYFLRPEKSTLCLFLRSEEVVKHFNTIVILSTRDLELPLIIVLGSLLITSEVSSIFEAAGEVTKNGSSLESNHSIKLSLS